MSDRQLRRGVPFVVSAPSGGGKTSLCRRVMEMTPGLTFSVSHTTRPPRGAEQNGVDYHFVDDATFDAMVAKGAFLEWAHVHRYRYGTKLALAQNLLEEGHDVFFDIDVQGGRQIVSQLPEAQLIFIVPPSLATLQTRLIGRGVDSEDQIAARMQAAADEIRDAAFYPYFLVNDRFDDAAAALYSIVVASRLRACEKGPLIEQVLRQA